MKSELRIKEHRVILKSILFFGLLFAIVCYIQPQSIKALNFSSNDGTTKIDLDGDGKKEKIKTTFSGKLSDDAEDGYVSYTFKVYINGKVALKKTEKDYGYISGIWVELFDYNPSDAHVDLMIMTGDRDYSYYQSVYRYSKKKLKKLFDPGNALTYDATILKDQQNDSYVLIENIRNSALGELYIPEQYAIKSKKLVFVRPKNFEYVLNIYNDYGRKSIHWYELSSGESLDDDDGQYYFVPQGTQFYVTKVRCNIVIDRFGKEYPEITEAYVITSSGLSGWLDVRCRSSYYSEIVTNATHYGM